MGQGSRQNDSGVILEGSSMKKRPVVGRAPLKPVKPTWTPKLDTLVALQGQHMSIPPPKFAPPSPRPSTVKTQEDGSENGIAAPLSLTREISSLRGELTKTNPYLSFIQTAPRVEKTFATKEEKEEKSNKQSSYKTYQEKLDRIKKNLRDKALVKKAILSLQRTAKLTNERATNQRRQRKAYSSPLYDAETRRNRTVRFQASHSALPITEEIKVPETTFQDVDESEEEEEEEEEEEDEDEGDGQMQIVEAEEDEVSVVLEYGSYDIIDPIEDETENISPTEIPTRLNSASVSESPLILIVRDHPCLDRKEHVTRADMTPSAKSHLRVISSNRNDASDSSLQDSNTKSVKKKKKKRITPQYNAALTKVREQNTLPEAELVTATESLAEKKAKAKRALLPTKVEEPPPPPAPPTPPRSPTPPPPPPPKTETPPPPPTPEPPTIVETAPLPENDKRGSFLAVLPRFTKPKVVKPPVSKPKAKPAAPPPKPPPPQQPQPTPKAPAKPPPQKAPTKMVPKPTPKPKAKPAPPPPKPKLLPPPPQPPTPKVQKPPKLKEKASPPKPVSVKKVKPIIIRTSTPEEEVKVAEFLPISGPEDHLSEAESVEETPSPPEDIKRSRSTIKKKERVERKALTPEPVPATPGGLTPPPFVHNKRGSIIWSDDEEEENDDDNDKVSVNSDNSNISVSALPPDLPTLDLDQQPTRKKRTKHALQIDLNASLNRRGPKRIDPAYEEEQRRLALAEQRRKRQQQLYNKLKNRPRQITRMESDTSSEGRASFEDYDFLAKYCIFHHGSLEMYKQAFNAVDDEERGWLNEEETAIALRGVNNKLSGAEEEFLYRIMELTGYSVSQGADFKLFSVLAALSHRISALDSWMKLMISETNFKLVEMKTFLCRNLWEICVDPETKKITLDQLIVELRSGGISRKHEEDVKQKLGHFSSMDLLDFLTYSPLFIMIHQSVIDNPLSDSRDK